jgi:flagellar hook assembly protein FlgD
MDVLGSSTLGVTPIVNGGNLSLVNYPNPFGATTTFSYTLPSAGEVTIEIRNMLGSVVKTLVNGEKQTAGDHKLKLDAISLENGMYTATLKLNTGDQTMTRTIKVIRNH